MHPDYSKAIQMYNNGIGTNTIASTLHRHRSTIQQWLKKSRIKLRKASPRSVYNIHFFSRYTPESCYWAGFIMADGCIRRTTVHIKLALKDREHLQKFLHCIQSNYSIKERENYCTIDISGQWFIKDLQKNFGIIPRKTFVTTFPKIPKKFHRHFIRGLFDGDGCITYTTCPTINFVGTTELLTSLTNNFKLLGINLKSGNLIPPIQIINKNIGHIHYSGKNAKTILDWVYKDTNESNRLGRKYNKYEKLFLCQ